VLAIDKEVAEKVMGWTLRDGWWVKPGEGTQKWVTTLELTLTRNEDDDSAYFDQEPWNPSTNIEQAFLVVNRMRGIDWQMQLFSVRKPDKNFFCAFYYNFSLWKELKTADYSSADTPAMAICLAALKATADQL
jgi:hypothetical protein